MTNGRPALTPDLIARFKHYHNLNPEWGSLHCVLSGPNVRDKHVRTCFDYAVAHDDPLGAALACILFELTQTQRRRIAWRALISDEI